MNSLMKFENKEVEIIELNGQFLFNPYHVGKCLDLTESAVRMSIKEMNSKQVIKLTNSDVNNNDIRKLNNAGENFLTESGVYKLIFKSRKPDAEKFQDWITDEVLPTLRKTGTYKISKNEDISKLEEMKIKASQDRAKAMLLNAQNRAVKTIMKTIEDKNLSKVAIEVFGLKCIEDLTGIDMGNYLPQVERTYTATEVGEMLGISANKVGALAKLHNLKTEENGVWVIDKSKHSNKEVSTFRYFEKGINAIKNIVV